MWKTHTFGVRSVVSIERDRGFSFSHNYYACDQRKICNMGFHGEKKNNQAVVNGSAFLDSKINEEFSVQGHSRDP